MVFLSMGIKTNQLANKVGSSDLMTNSNYNDAYLRKAPDKWDDLQKHVSFIWNLEDRQNLGVNYQNLLYLGD